MWMGSDGFEAGMRGLWRGEMMGFYEGWMWEIPGREGEGGVFISLDVVEVRRTRKMGGWVGVKKKGSPRFYMGSSWGCVWRGEGLEGKKELMSESSPAISSEG